MTARSHDGRWDDGRPSEAKSAPRQQHPKPWSTKEIALVDNLIREGIAASQCVHLFAQRTPDSVDCRFASRRKVLGIAASKTHSQHRPSLKAALERISRIRAVPVEKPVALVANFSPAPTPNTDATPEAAACRQMLRRHLETGAHWLRPDRVAAAYQQAMS